MWTREAANAICRPDYGLSVTAGGRPDGLLGARECVLIVEAIGLSR